MSHGKPHQVWGWDTLFANCPVIVHAMGIWPKCRMESTWAFCFTFVRPTWITFSQRPAARFRGTRSQGLSEVCDSSWCAKRGLWFCCPTTSSDPRAPYGSCEVLFAGGGRGVVGMAAGSETRFSFPLGLTPGGKGGGVPTLYKKGFKSQPIQTSKG